MNRAHPGDQPEQRYAHGQRYDEWYQFQISEVVASSPQAKPHEEGTDDSANDPDEATFLRRKPGDESDPCKQEDVRRYRIQQRWYEELIDRLAGNEQTGRPQTDDHIVDQVRQKVASARLLGGHVRPCIKGPTRPANANAIAIRPILRIGVTVLYRITLGGGLAVIGGR
jgi:hypothetical protein